MQTRNYRNYTDEDIIQAAKEVETMAGLLRKLGLQAGANYANMKRNLQRLNVDTSHWTGQAWSKGKQLKDWSDYTRAVRLKPHLIKERGHKCELCELSEWMEEPIALEVHHINGDRTHNEPSNLQLLCPNCHATTDNWRGRKNKNCGDSDSNRDYSTFKIDDSTIGLPPRRGTIKTKAIKICKDCPKIITKVSERCKSCTGKKRKNKIEWPSVDCLIEMVKEKGYCGTGRLLGVSDQAVRKRIRNHS